jgi:hypothetical protein
MFVVVYIEYGFACKHAWNIMRKSKVLQLGFWIATNTCNSQYLYSCEFYQTSCNKHVYNPYIHLRCNLVHFNCNWLSTLISCTNSCRQKKISVTFHTSINGWSMFISFELIYNCFSSSFWPKKLNIFSFIHWWMDEIYMFIAIVLQFRQCKNKND